MKLIILSILFCLPLASMEIFKILPNSYYAPERLGAVELYQTPAGFAVVENGQLHKLKCHEVDSLLIKVQQKKCLGKFLQAGYISVDKMEDGNFTLKAKVRGDGGFLLTGVIVHQACRVVGYSGLVLGGIGAVTVGLATGGPGGAVIAASAVIQAAPATSAAVEAGSLAIGVAASFIPLLP
jgi:hypothetical protein